MSDKWLGWVLVVAAAMASCDEAEVGECTGGGQLVQSGSDRYCVFTPESVVAAGPRFRCPAAFPMLTEVAGAAVCTSREVDPGDLPARVCAAAQVSCAAQDAGATLIDSSVVGDGGLPISDAGLHPDEGVADATPLAGVDCRFVAVAGGQWHACAIGIDRSLWCWGWNNVGQLGTGALGDQRERPVRVGTDTDWLSITAGEGHTCGLRADGGLWCWGWNSSGQLGLLDSSDRSRPTRVDGGPFTSVRVGYRFTCARQEDGSLWCWGENRQGQLGQGVLGNRNYLSRVTEADDWGDIDEDRLGFGGGGWHACGIRSGGLWCWGWNASGQLGVGDGMDRLEPTRVGVDDDWASVATGYWHTCALRTGGSLWCWGQGNAGRLGLGDTVGHDEPVQVGHLSSWARVHRGGHHTCAEQLDGSSWCWGANGDGQLGVGDDSHRASPTRLEGTWSSLGLGGDFTCGLDIEGALFCWGLNEHGMLGLGDTERRSRPERVTCPSE